MGLYMAVAGSTWNLQQDYCSPLSDLLRSAMPPMAYTKHGAISDQFLLDFLAFQAFNPRTFSERRSFRPAARPLRPEANARQRDAPSGAKVFG
jgi:hypothetical protein